jgi:hypothetical protein
MQLDVTKYIRAVSFDDGIHLIPTSVSPAHVVSEPWHPDNVAALPLLADLPEGELAKLAKELAALPNAALTTAEASDSVASMKSFMLRALNASAKPARDSWAAEFNKSGTTTVVTPTRYW